MEALQQILLLPLSLFTSILWIIIYNLCKLGGGNTLEHRVTFSVLPYGVNVPEAHFKEASPGPFGSLTGNREGQVILATEVKPGLAS